MRRACRSDRPAPRCRPRSSTAMTACRSARREYSRRPSSTAATASGDAEGSSTAPPAPQPSTQCQRPPAATRSTTCAAHSTMSRCDNSSVSVAHRSRYSSLHIGQPAPSASTITTMAASGAAAEATSASCPIRSASASDRSTRITDPNSPSSIDISTNDFSGTKPSTAGSAAITAPGRFSSKSGRCLVMAHTLAIGTVSPSAVRTAPRVRCGQTRRWGQPGRQGRRGRTRNRLFTCCRLARRARGREPA